MQEVYRQAIEFYGKKHQLIKLAEECAELIQAIAKFQLDEKVENWSRIKEEMADVRIVLNQFINSYEDIDDTFYETFNKFKLRLNDEMS